MAPQSDDELPAIGLGVGPTERYRGPDGFHVDACDPWILSCPVSHDTIEVDPIETLTSRRWVAECPSCGALHRIEIIPKSGAAMLGTTPEPKNDLRGCEISSDGNSVVIGLSPEDDALFELSREANAPDLIFMYVDSVVQTVPLWPFGSWEGLEISSDLLGMLTTWQEDQVVQGSVGWEEWLTAGRGLVEELRAAFPGVTFQFWADGSYEHDQD